MPDFTINLDEPNGFLYLSGAIPSNTPISWQVQNDPDSSVEIVPNHDGAGCVVVGKKAASGVVIAASVGPKGQTFTINIVKEGGGFKVSTSGALK